MPKNAGCPAVSTRPQSHSPRASTQSDAFPARAGRTEARGEGCRLISGDPGLTALLPRLHRGPAPSANDPDSERLRDGAGLGAAPGGGAALLPTRASTGAGGGALPRTRTAPPSPASPACSPTTPLPLRTWDSSGPLPAPRGSERTTGCGSPCAPGQEPRWVPSAEGREWAGGAAGATWGDRVLDPSAVWKLREAGEVQVEGMTWAGEPTWAGDLGHRAGEGCPGPVEQMLRVGDSLPGGVCMRITTVVY